MAVLTIDNVWRDNVTAGVPASGDHDPDKAQIRQVLNQLAQGASLGALIYTTKALLDANTGATDDQMAWVVADSTAANNGIYQSDTGAWTRRRGLPDGTAVLTNIGGTANAITADTATGVDPAEVQLLILPDPPGTTTSTTVTLALNGGSAESVKSASGSDPAIGDIIDGVGTLFFRSGSEWRQLVPSRGHDTLDYQGDWEDDPTTYTQGQFVTKANALYYLDAASSTGADPASGAPWVEVFDFIDGFADNSITTTKLSQSYDTRTDAVAATIPASQDWVRTAGYAAVGDGGGALYKRVVSEPAHAGKFQSADGAWWELAVDVVTPEMFSASGDGVTDDKAEIEAAATVAVALAVPIRLSGGVTYAFSTIEFPAGCAVMADGAILQALGGLAATSDVEITVGDNCIIDSIFLSHPGGTRTNFYMVSIGDDVRLGRCTVVADAQTNNSCVHMIGSRSEIEYLLTQNVDRPLTIEGETSTTAGCCIWNINIENYVRGVRVSNHEKYVIGNHLMRGRSSNVPVGSITPGHNGILIDGAPNGTVFDGTVEDAGEHAYRIGGNTDTRSNTITFGNLTAIRPRGCAFKVNALGKNNAPVDYAENVSIAYLVGIDVGDGQLGELGKQPDFCRISSTKGFRLGGGKVIADQQTVSCLAAIAINDADDIVIGPVDAQNTASSLFVVREAQDVNPGDEGSVTNVRVNGLTGSLNHPSANTAVTFDTTQDVSDIYLNSVEVSGYNTRLLIFDTLINVTGRIAIHGKSYGSVLPLITDVPSSSLCTLEWAHNGISYYTGQTSLWRFGVGAWQVAGTDPLDLSGNPTGLLINNAGLTASLNAYTAGLEFSRNGTSRRGAAIAGKHTSSDLDQAGLAFLIKNSTLGGSDALIEGMALDHNGNLSITGALSKGSGTFKIDHPLDPEAKHLIHGFIEGPRYDLIYRGTATLVNGRATVLIDDNAGMSDGTFEALTQSAEVVSLHNRDGFSRVRATGIVNGSFEIMCENDEADDRVSWVVMAERADRFVRESDPWTGPDGRLIPEHKKN
jgi:hypothetical protein